MAEIKIEKKTPIWPWILVGLLILAAILYFVFRDDDNDDVAKQGVADSTQVVQPVGVDNNQNVQQGNATGPVASYQTFVDTSGNMGFPHEYTSNGLQLLIDAVRSKADQIGVNINANLDQAQQLSNKIKEDTHATSHAGSIREAAENIGKALQTMQEAKYPNLNNDMQQVKQAIQSINPKTDVLNQKESVKSFFSQSAQLLKQM